MQLLFETIENTKATHHFSDETLDKLQELFYQYKTEPMYEYFDNYVTVAQDEKLILIIYDISHDMTEYRINVFKYTDKEDFITILDEYSNEMVTKEDYETDDSVQVFVDSLF